MAASADWGRFPNRPGAALTIKMTRAAPVTPVSWIFAPDRSVTAVRDPLAELGRRRYSLASTQAHRRLCFVRFRQTWRGAFRRRCAPGRRQEAASMFSRLP